MNDPDCVAWTMTIRFTDDGLSLGRREGAYAMGFFPHPRRDPDKVGKLLSLFAGIAVQPHVDYLANGLIGSIHTATGNPYSVNLPVALNGIKWRGDRSVAP